MNDELQQLLSNDHINDLMFYLARSGVSVMTWWDAVGEVHCSVEGCDGSDRHSREWAEAQCGDAHAARTWLDRVGFPCDCAVLEAVIDSGSQQGDFPEAQACSPRSGSSGRALH